MDLVQGADQSIRLSDPQNRQAWINDGFDRAQPKKLKRFNNKMRPSYGVKSKRGNQMFNDQMLSKRAKKKDFELGPRLKSISLDTDEHIIWPGAMREGYGVKKSGKTTINAHRYVYETATGKKIPKGWHIDHKCRERRCINPKHLEPVSPGENKRRAWQSKYLREGSQDKVTDKDVRV